MNEKEIEYYFFQYAIPIYKIKPPKTFCDYFQTHKDEIIIELDKKNKRLNNIINELEKYITETKLKEFEKEYGRRYAKTFTQAEVIICNMILDKLQELKGSDKE